MHAKRGITLRLKLMLASAAAATVILVFTGVVVRLQMGALERSAELEARHLAASVAHAVSLTKGNLQLYVEGISILFDRDIVIVDTHKRGIADASAHEIGRIYNGDADDAVGKTIRDGQVRVFVETNEQHPEGAKQIVVPRRAGVQDDAPILGAVILEYTEVHRELPEWQIYTVGGVGLLLVALVGFFGMRLGSAVSGQLMQLSRGLQRVASGHYDTRLPVATRDEIGMLTEAFNRMTNDLQVTRNELLNESKKENEAAKQIEYLAFHDKLTGLPNRSLFSQTLEQEMKEARLRQAQLAVLFVDLDRFKNINDTLGHTAGDTLIKEMSARLCACVGEQDSVARLGGDEFVIMATSVADSDEVAVVAQKILAAVSRPFQLHDHQFHLTASVGISVFPADGDDERLLMKNADIAMYQAKADGKNTFAFYSAALNTHSVERLAFESSLRRALEERQLELHYQPKVDCVTSKMTGVEALLRWKHPDLGMVSPARFIPVAEENGLIVPIGRWVLQTACEQHMAWRRLGHSPLRVAVNLSARQFYDDHLLADVRSILAQTGMNAGYLELEITESMLMRNVEKASEVLFAFKAMGICLALDDFGTGYSSLSNLKRFPIDMIKIDRSFIRDLPGNQEDRAITDAIIAMGRTLNMKVVAEGVETRGQIEFLRSHACDEFQGFFFSKPVPSAAITDLLSAQPWAQAKDSGVAWGVEGVFPDSRLSPISTF